MTSEHPAEQAPTRRTCAHRGCTRTVQTQTRDHRHQQRQYCSKHRRRAQHPTRRARRPVLQAIERILEKRGTFDARQIRHELEGRVTTSAICRVLTSLVQEGFLEAQDRSTRRLYRLHDALDTPARARGAELNTERAFREGAAEGGIARAPPFSTSPIWKTGRSDVEVGL